MLTKKELQEIKDMSPRQLLEEYLKIVYIENKNKKRVDKLMKKYTKDYIHVGFKKCA